VDRDMSPEANKAVVREHFEQVWNRGIAEAVAETLAPDYVGYDPNSAGAIQGPDGYLKATAAFRAAFPDARFTIEELIAEGDRVVVRLVLRATQSDSWHGAVPSHRAISVDGVIIYRMANGTIVESWGLFNVLGMLQQLGRLETPPAARRETDN
jgi:steroid delta-isomerase-like uncharacterized protein